MAVYAVGVSPEVLRWAREQAGYSIEEVAQSFKQDAEVIKRWETGDQLPTYNQLEKLAYTLYKRPIALFFFPYPPQEPEPQKSFRTLPDAEIEALVPDTRHAIRQARMMQLSLIELTGGVNPSERKIFRDIQANPNMDVVVIALQVRNYLGVSINDQISWRGVESALANWRDVVQDNGIFIFKRSFKQRDVSGFCLLHEEFPVIYLNNSSAKTRQIFTIFHELAHLLLETNGVTKQDDDYIRHLTGNAKDVEVFCNQFAAEFLVPNIDFEQHLDQDADVDQLIEKLTDRYKVSREVILRKLRDLGRVDNKQYETKAEQWNNEYEENQAKKGGGGDYYATQATYLGEKYLDLAFRRYFQGAVTREQLADYLNVKANSVGGLEQAILRKAATQ